MSPPKIILGAQARHKLTRGFNQLADLLALTLGPRGRTIVVESHHRNRPPELLDDGALIARRFTGLPDRFETMGAFIARQIAWQVEETVGDGSSTAVVFAREILNQSQRMIAAGHNAMRLCRGLEIGMVAILDQLRRVAQPVVGQQQMRNLAIAITGDERLGRHIEEIFDIVGAHGAIDVRLSYALGHEREYIRGAFWNQGWVSSYFTTEPGTAVVKKPHILFTNCHLQSADELLPILEQVQRRRQSNKSAEGGLVVIAPDVTGEALNLLVANKSRGVVPTLAIKAPGLGSEKTEILHDLAALCGGHVFASESGESIKHAQIDQLGRSDEVQAIRSGFTLIGGKGRPADVRQRVADLRSQLTGAPYGRDRDRLVERTGKLVGGVALLKVGGVTESERTYFKNRAEEAVRSLRLALDGGVVAGGGAAYLACLPVLDQLELAEDEAAAIPVLRSALVAPLATIVRNAGFESSPILARLADSPPGSGFDVNSGQIVAMLAAHIVDPLAVASEALRIGMSGALMALTTDAAVHKPRSNRDKAVDFEV